MNQCTMFRRVRALLILLLLILPVAASVSAQTVESWSIPQRIPGYEGDVVPPVLIADQNRTVHAFTNQLVGDDNPDQAVTYRQWTMARGWTAPVDVLLSPLKRHAEVKGAFLDERGIIHVVFYGGDQTDANLYYARALAANADRAQEWTRPMLIGPGAASPTSAALVGDDSGNLHVLYGGNREGNGVYAASSPDGGDTWSEATPIFLTYNDERWPWGLVMERGQSGSIQAIWNVVNPAGQGEAIYTAQLPSGSTEWTQAILLASGAAGSLGVFHPTIIEHDGTIIATFIITPKVTVRRSEDGGKTWSALEQPFQNHVGVNGTLSNVVDAGGVLHLLFGQRITGTPDIHGMWHSMWRDNRWSPPVAVTSGPRVIDLVGESGFDPFDARAVVVQGNELLVTWRSDPGNINPNGVWFSHLSLNVEESPLVPLPVASPVTPRESTTPEAESPADMSTPVVGLPASETGSSLDQAQLVVPEAGNPMMPILAGVIPALVLVLIVAAWFWNRDLRRKT